MTWGLDGGSVPESEQESTNRNEESSYATQRYANPRLGLSRRSRDTVQLDWLIAGSSAAVHSAVKRSRWIFRWHVPDVPL